MGTTRSEALAQLVPEDLRHVLRTRTLVLQRPAWGRRFGRHRSSRAGVGLDFRDHRPYVQGDDPRRLDWRAIARRDRFVLRRTEAEDELSIAVVLDGGGAMAYGNGRAQKMRTATAVAGALAWLASTQGDRLGLAIGADGAVDGALLRPSGGRERLAAITTRLTEHDAAGLCPWDDLLGEVAPRLPRRSLVVVLSDFLDPGGTGDRAADARLFRGLSHLRARGHDVVLGQVLHRDELTFPWEERRMLKFLDLRKRRDPIEGAGGSMRDAYLARLGEHLQWLADRCEASGLFLQRFVTDESLTESFLSLLSRLAGPGATGSLEAER